MAIDAVQGYDSGAMVIRTAQPQDHAAFVPLFDALESGDAAPVADVWQSELMPRTLVFDGGEGDGVVGYVYFEVLEAMGYVRHVAVDAGHRTRGIGRSLLMAVAARLRDQGLGEWGLNVKPGNRAAIALYESLGMARRYASVVVRFGWEIRAALPGGDAEVRILEPADDAEVELALGLPAGLLAPQRGERRHLLAARRGGGPVGVAVFHPAFPGGYPFRAVDVPAMRSLLDAMHARRDPSFDHVQVVLEDSESLAAALVEAGGRRHMEIVHMRGAVPADPGAAEPDPRRDRT